MRTRTCLVVAAGVMLCFASMSSAVCYSACDMSGLCSGTGPYGSGRYYIGQGAEYWSCRSGLAWNSCEQFRSDAHCKHIYNSQGTYLYPTYGFLVILGDYCNQG